MTDTCLFERLEPNAGIARAMDGQGDRSVRIGGNVLAAVTVLNETFEDEQGRDREAKADLEGVRGVFSPNPVS